jgi:hypothetical protein
MILRLIYIVVILIVVGAYAGLIVWAGFASLGNAPEPDIPGALTGVVTGVGGVLATNFGAFLGVAVSGGTGGNRGLLMTNARDAFRAPTAQAWASLGYLLVLLACFAFWILDGFSATTAEVIRTQTLTLFGVGVGALAVQLNVKRP